MLWPGSVLPVVSKSGRRGHRPLIMKAKQALHHACPGYGVVSQRPRDPYIVCRSNPADTVDFHGADAPVQLAEGAAGQKVAVKMVPASKAQQDAAQATAPAKPPSTNGHSAPIEVLSIKQRAIDNLAEGSGGGRPSRGMCFQEAFESFVWSYSQ